MTQKPQAPDLIPDGLLVDRAWLRKRGVERPNIDYYLRTGALQRVARGVYRRPGPALPWQCVVYSLHEVGYDVHVGGETALDEQGFGHFAQMRESRKITLFTYMKLPHWLTQWQADGLQTTLSYYFEIHRHNWLDVAEDFLVAHSAGQWNWQIKYANPELALFELLVEVKAEKDFQQLDRAFEAFTSFSPRRLQSLLSACPNIKAKRLFGWFAARHQHAWYKNIDWKRVDLGSGKRSIVKGGRYDSEWQITVPRRLEADSEYGSE